MHILTLVGSIVLIRWHESGHNFTEADLQIAARFWDDLLSDGPAWGDTGSDRKPLRRRTPHVSHPPGFSFFDELPRFLEVGDQALHCISKT